MSEYRPEAWQRLARLLKSRRVHISTAYRTRTAFCEATGLNYKLVSDIENAPDTRTNFTDEYFALLESGYQLAEGSIRRALDGGPLETRASEVIAQPLEEAVGSSAPKAVAPAAGEGGDDPRITEFLHELLASVDQRLAEQSRQLARQSQQLAEQSMQLAEQNRRIEELQREQQREDTDKHHKSA